ncbi:hypothetical protein LBMAG53_10580 [Planctomycetota bacterium]|nr:hypothetical protein LBMAG53_10580 [Planctomycetota bacterium]
MPPLTDLVIGLAVPAVLAAVGAALSRLLPAAWAGSGVVLSIAFAYAVGLLLLVGWPGLPPRFLQHWPLFLVPAAAIPLAMLAMADGWLSRLGGAVLFAAAVLAADTVIFAALSSNCSLATEVFWTQALGWGVVHLAAIKFALAGGSAVPGVVGHLTGVGVALATVACCVLNGVLPTGSLLLLLGASLGAAALAWWRSAEPVLAAAALGAVVLIAGQILLIQRMLNDPPLPVPALLLLAVTPLGLLLGRIPLLTGTWLGGLLALGGAASFAIAAIVWVALFGQPPPSDGRY